MIPQIVTALIAIFTFPLALYALDKTPVVSSAAMLELNRPVSAGSSIILDTNAPTFPLEDGDFPHLPAGLNVSGMVNQSATVSATQVISDSEQTYTVVSGDNPWLIAQKVYGNGAKYPLILSANKLTESSRLQVGMILVIPPLAGSTPTPLPSATQSTITPEPTPLQTLPAPSAAPPTVAVMPPTFVAPTQQPTSLPTATSAPAPGFVGGWIQASASPDLAVILDILGWISMLGSLICAFLSYQAYHRARRLRRMMIMSYRARARL